jgi:alpha-beta hydrolase superfamily lysophospholipase
MEEQTFVDAYGIEVFARWWTIADPRGLVVISHGASEHSGRYDRFARALNAAGYAAVAIDHRGHGVTGRVTGPGIMGPPGGIAVVDDLHELRTAAEAVVGAGVPVFVFGHSLGSLIGLAYLLDHSTALAGAVLCGLPLDVETAAAAGPVLEGFAAAGLRDEPVADLLAGNNAAFEPVRTAADWLSRDPAEVDAYLADPLCGDSNPLTYGYLIDLFEVVGPAPGRLDAIMCPVLLIAGDQDPAAGNGAHPTALAKALTAAGVENDLKLYPGARHELLNETNRDEVTADVIGWLDRHRD